MPLGVSSTGTNGCAKQDVRTVSGEDAIEASERRCAHRSQPGMRRKFLEFAVRTPAICANRSGFVDTPRALASVRQKKLMIRLGHRALSADLPAQRA